VLHQAVGIDPARVVDEAEVVKRVAEGLRVVAAGGVDRPLLELDLLGAETLGHPEVEERDPAVVHQQVVAGVGIGVEVPQVVDRPEAEAEDDLAEDVALVLLEILDLLEPRPSTYSLTSTAVARAGRTFGTWMNGWPSYARAKARWFCASNS
jgi:hypothetical protein